MCEARVSAPSAIELAAALATVMMVGCAQPVCAATPMGEMQVHVDGALRAIVAFHGERALEEIGVALGMTAHPAPPQIDGGISIVTPFAPAATPGSPEIATPHSDSEEG